jgi:Zn-dependent protease
MRNLYHVLTIRGMPVRLHYTWLIAALLGVPVMSGVIIPIYLPDMGGLARFGLALLILALFFLSIVLHECAHMLVAWRFQTQRGAINLYPLGSLTQLADRFSDAKIAFWVAAAGPIASLILWGILNGISSAGIIALPLAVLLYLVGQLNMYLALINLIPGLPLDGGRMLRAVLWGMIGSFDTATNIARTAGQISTYLLMIVGALLMVGGQGWVWALALISVGWVIRVAGGTAYRRALVSRLFNKLTAADVLINVRRTIGPEASLRTFTATMRGRTGHQPVPVIANDMFLGMIDWEDLSDVPQGYWETRTVAETMIPSAKLDVVTPDTPVSMLLPRLIGGMPGQYPLLPVVQDGRLLGVIDAAQMLAILDLEDEFGLFAHEPTIQPQTDVPALAGTTLPSVAPSVLEAQERAAGR